MDAVIKASEAFKNAIEEVKKNLKESRQTIQGLMKGLDPDLEEASDYETTGELSNLDAVSDTLEKAINGHTLYASFFRNAHPKVAKAYAAYCAAYVKAELCPEEFPNIFADSRKCKQSYEAMTQATIVLRDVEENAGLSTETREVPIDELFVGTSKDIYGNQSIIEFHLGKDNLHSLVRFQSHDANLLSHKLGEAMSGTGSHDKSTLLPTSTKEIAELLREAATGFRVLKNDFTALKERSTLWGEHRLWSPSICVSTNRYFDNEDALTAKPVSECNVILASENSGTPIMRPEWGSSDSLAGRVATLSLNRAKYAPRAQCTAGQKQLEPRRGCHSVALSLESLADHLSPSSNKMETSSDSDAMESYSNKRKRDETKEHEESSRGIKRVFEEFEPSEAESLMGPQHSSVDTINTKQPI